MSRLKKLYNSKVKKLLLEKFAYSNVMKIPRLEKIVINMGIGEAARDKSIVQDHMNELTSLAGQKAVPAKARKAVSNFKTRVGMPIGAMVTLRGERAYDWLDRFANVVSPRIPDFRGFNTKGDGQGNYTLGLTDQQVFPEVNLDTVKRTQGMTVTFVTTATNDEECVELLRLMGIPFKNLAVEVTI